MPILEKQFQDLAYLAEELENGQSFDINLKYFVDQSNQLKKELFYYYGDHAWIVDRLNRIPAWDFTPVRKRFLENLLPKAGRDMYGTYQHKQKIMDQVRTIADTYAFIYNQLS